MDTKCAGDIMIPLEDYPHIPYWFTLRQAIAAIEKSEISFRGKKSLPRALLVFDEKYQLTGIVRRRDILGGLEPSFLAKKPTAGERKLFDVDVDPDLAELSFAKDIESIKERAEVHISEVMAPIIGTVNHGDHLSKIIYVMLSKDIHLLPVTKNGKVVGVVRSVDVFNEVADLLL